MSDTLIYNLTSRDEIIGTALYQVNGEFNFQKGKILLSNPAHRIVTNITTIPMWNIYGKSLNLEWNADDYIFPNSIQATKDSSGNVKLTGMMKPSTGGSKTSMNYKKTTKKHTDSKGKTYVIYKKGDKSYIKKLSKSTGKFTYRAIKA